MDEFDLFRACGLIDPTTAERILPDADSVIARIENDESPSNSAWPTWRPDPLWPIPKLPEGWETIG